MNTSKIGIVGQGFVGSAVREGFSNFVDVLAYDKDPSKNSNCKSLRRPSVTTWGMSSAMFSLYVTSGGATVASVPFSTASLGCGRMPSTLSFEGL